MTRKLLGILLLIGLLIICGCGGGGAGVVSSGSQPTNAIISFSLISTAQLPVRMNGVQMSATLPAGVTVTTGDPTNPKMITSGLAAGSATASVLTGQLPIFGSYSAPKVTILVADSTPTQAGFGPGEMARLTVSLAAGGTISEIDRQAIENSVTFKASGWDPNAATNPRSLTGFLKPKVAVTTTN